MHHRRGRRGRAPARHARGQDAAAGPRRARDIGAAPGARLAALDRADAGRRAGGHVRHRRRGRAQRGAVRRGDPRARGRRARRAARRLPRGPDRARAQAHAARGPRDPARRHRRHARRRPARPDVHAPGALDGLRRGGARSRSTESGRAAWPTAISGPSTPTRPRSTRWPRRAPRSRPSSRTSRRRRSSGSRGTSIVRPRVGALAIAQDRIAEKRFLQRVAGSRRRGSAPCTRPRSSQSAVAAIAIARAAQDQPAGLRWQGAGGGDRRAVGRARHSSGSAACPACWRSG